MSRKRFTTMVVVVLLMGMAGLIGLYMTLGRMNDMLRAHGKGPSTSVPPPAAETIEQMTLTPAGESELRRQRAAAAPAARPSSAAAAPAPSPAKPAAAAPAPSAEPAGSSPKSAPGTGKSGS